MFSLPFLFSLVICSVIAQSERHLGNYALDKQRAEAAAAAEYANCNPCATQTSNTSILTSSVVCVNGPILNGTLFNGTLFNSTFLNNTNLNGANVSCYTVFIQNGTISTYRLSNGKNLVINTGLGQILPWPVCPPPLTAEQIAARDAEMYAKAMDQLKLMGIIAGTIILILIVCRTMCLTQICKNC